MPLDARAAQPGGARRPHCPRVRRGPRRVGRRRRERWPLGRARAAGRTTRWLPSLSATWIWQSSGCGRGVRSSKGHLKSEGSVAYVLISPRFSKVLLLLFEVLMYFNFIIFGGSRVLLRLMPQHNGDPPSSRTGTKHQAALNPPQLSAVFIPKIAQQHFILPRWSTI